MTAKTNKIPPIVKFGAWLLSLIAFVVGFWHSHLGLREMRPFESAYGSLLIAAIVLLLVLISYNIAVNGRKIALAFYVIGGFVFFIFNLNYFYPSYLGRKLINEETNQINEVLTKQKNKLNSISQVKKTEYINTLNNLLEIKQNILAEIASRGGFGTYANQELNKFKKLTGSELTGERLIKRDPIEQAKLYQEWEKKLDDAIMNYVATTISGDDKNKLEIVYANADLNKFYDKYNPILDSIGNDDKRIILDSLKFDSYLPSKQIKTLKIVVDKINQTDIRVNTALNKPQPPVFSKEYPKSKQLGKFEHTMSSIGERINKIDTWGIIFLCLFIDLLVPLFIYVMIRRKEDDENLDATSFWDNITGKKRPSTF
jgi:hypothetical protein